jgi:hypothetical protein
MKTNFTTADVCNVISALTCYVTNDFDKKRTIEDIANTISEDKDVVEHLIHCMNIIKNYK